MGEEVRGRGRRLTKSATDTGSAVRSKKEEVVKAKGTADDFLKELDIKAEPLPGEQMFNDFKAYWQRGYEPRGNMRLICQCGVPGCMLGPMTRAYY